MGSNVGDTSATELFWNKLNTIPQQSQFIQRFLMGMTVQCFANVNKLNSFPTKRKPPQAAENTTMSNISVSVQSIP
jgi:hypothetical protein